MALKLQSLSPREFDCLQQYVSYAPRRLKDVIGENGGKNLSEEMLGYKAFVEFLEKYLDTTLSDDLLRHFFALLKRSCIDVNQREHSASGLSVTSPQGVELESAVVCLQDVVCYLSMLEASKPEDKLEFIFHLYDSDRNGILDAKEIDTIISQMVTIADYLGWDVSELNPILRGMISLIDYDEDGAVSLEEWRKGTFATIPLLVLLGLDMRVRDDGHHLWRLKHFGTTAFCNMCLNKLSGLGKKGLQCVLCHYTVHERCVAHVPATCITTYVKSMKAPSLMLHFWVEGNCSGRCFRCRRKVDSSGGVNGLHCRWCQITVHNLCAPHIKPDCNFNRFRDHVIPPYCLCPVVLDRHRSRNKYSESLRRSSFSSVDGLQELFQVTVPKDTHPLVILVNPKSGGKQGSRVLAKFRYMLNPRQVFDISKGGPSAALSFIKEVANARILVCGGDGTVGWVLEAMDHVSWENETPPVAVLPLGTGNDMARCLGWGPGYDGDDLAITLDSLEGSNTIVALDRWQVQLGMLDEGSDVISDGATTEGMPNSIMNNYLSIGVDASICHRFHHMREKHPERFSSRIKNYLYYLEFGTTETLFARCKNLHEFVSIKCDGQPLEFPKGQSLQGVAVLNIPSIYGGSNLWGESEQSLDKTTTDPLVAPAIGDRLLEIVGLEGSMHVGQVKAGLRSSGIRLAQCATLELTILRSFPMQIDGEPWIQEPATLTITHKNQVSMLLASDSNKRNGTSKYLCCV